MIEPLRCITYLVPGLPLGLFEFLAEYAARALGWSWTLEVESRWSGPPAGQPDPLRLGLMDLAFMCAPSFVRLRSEPAAGVELLPAGMVFDDPRNGGRPVYFADVLVREHDAARSFSDLRGAVWGYNDRVSQSGYAGMLQHLAILGEDPSFFGRLVETGSHHLAIEALLSGSIDTASIDSNTLRRCLPAGLRILASLGPFPIQPVVLRAGLPARDKRHLSEAFIGLEADPTTAAMAATFGLLRFVPVDEKDYLGI
ncbi:MAG: PhnD/SsuA/transferrin family substrate-binding protein [Chloroflexi bacterium]|nr:PhnD/SsuA/transferrin family substrate-binding protein [Chloroflexota bacterium]